MTRMFRSLVLPAVVLVACGDNRQLPDAAPRPDVLGPDAMCSNCPPAPVLGTTMIDRAGRPAINTLLNHSFDTNTSTANTAKDAYNANTNQAGWVAAYAAELKKNLAFFDALDADVCGNALCEMGETTVNCPADCPTSSGTASGCGNQLMYQTPTSATSYGQLANLLADDVLYIDTSKPTCSSYLAVELSQAMGVPNATCGGRAPNYDVIDFTYAAFAMGTAGFSFSTPTTARFNCDSLGEHCGDDVGPHGDYLSAFPYLGDPH